MYVLIILSIFCLFYYQVDNYPEKGKHLVPKDSFYENSPRITFHFYSSPMGVDWKGPRALFISTLKSLIHPYNRLISHVAVEVQGEGFYRFTSMTDRGKGIFKKLFVDQVGMGMMLVNYPGKLESDFQLQTETNQKRSSGRVQSLTFLVTEDHISRVQKYLEEYYYYGVDKVYGGLKTDPRKKQGAGCLPFSKSIAEIAGLSELPFFETIKKSIFVPNSLIGLEVRRASVFDVLNTTKWGRNAQDSEVIEIWDLDFIFQQIASKGGESESSIFNELEIYKTRKIKRSFELIVDARNLNVPTEDFWY
jgi:hypothetical protein